MTFLHPPGTRLWERRVGDRFPASELPLLAPAVNRVMADLERTLSPDTAERLTISLRSVPGQGWSTGYRFDAGHGEYGFGADDAEHAAYGVADAISTGLAGYEFVQWPTMGGRMLTATLRDGGAVWADMGADAVIAPVGRLGARPAGDVNG